ncbi:hypothetical protein [Blastopirellula marina]|uniref:Uncharacterized protein n=1 Tax=Blastopirellula marina TaxID=124 RepID=A0A2S8FSH1_9BACT|nr:hypothetical protein [Blastopirellula marina]PQO35129.1 hypothetical protein C5Y98_14350 [Blastopirellula marina]PTL43878.1 hypothetical protein C5Y97_14360 [Blastopirellula marina]
MGNVRWGAIFLLACQVSWLHAETPDPRLQVYFDSVAKIRSFDVMVNETTKFHYKTERAADQPLGQRVPKLTHRKYLPSEVPTERSAATRQVWEAETKRRRVEHDVTPNGNGAISIFNGKTVTAYNKTASFGTVAAQNPGQRPLVHSSSRYDTLLGEIFLGGEYQEMFAKRQPVETKEVDGDLLVTSPAQPGPMYPSCTFELLLDKEHGFLPKKITVSSKGRIDFDVEVMEFRSLGDGVWVPTKSRFRDYLLAEQIDPVFPVHFLTTEVSIDVDRSAWNQPIPEETFHVLFPAGTGVLDEINHARLTLSKDTDSDDIGGRKVEAEEYQQLNANGGAVR